LLQNIKISSVGSRLKLNADITSGLAFLCLKDGSTEIQTMVLEGLISSVSVPPVGVKTSQALSPNLMMHLEEDFFLYYLHNINEVRAQTLGLLVTTNEYFRRTFTQYIVALQNELSSKYVAKQSDCFASNIENWNPKKPFTACFPNLDNDTRCGLELLIPILEAFLSSELLKVLSIEIAALNTV
jgi:hypothetical protein